MTRPGSPQPVSEETVVHTSATHSRYSTPNAKELEHREQTLCSGCRRHCHSPVHAVTVLDLGTQG